MSPKGWAERRVHLPHTAADTSANAAKDGCCWWSLLQRHITRSCSAQCPPGHLDPFMQACFPASQPQPIVFCGLICPQVLPILSPGLCTSLCWTVWGSSQPIPLTYWGSSEWQHIHLMLFFPDFLSSSNMLRVPSGQLSRSLWRGYTIVDAISMPMDTTSDWLPDEPYAIWQNPSNPEV